MIAGGTTESRAATEALLEQGYRVLLSQATQEPFALRAHPRLARRQGYLTAAGWRSLAQTGAAAIVDAAHPHAIRLRETLREVATQSGLALVRLKRSEVVLGESALRVSNHTEAARVACELGDSILITAGTRNLAPYVSEARRSRS